VTGTGYRILVHAAEAFDGMYSTVILKENQEILV